jgi:hypothetical protein
MTTLVYTKEKNVRVTMECVSPKDIFSGPTLFIDMVQWVLWWERQKDAMVGKKLQGPTVEKHCYNNNN